MQPASSERTNYPLIQRLLGWLRHSGGKVMGRKKGTRNCTFDDKYEECPTTGCFLWTAALTNTGYAKHTGLIKGHRFAWERKHGPVPDGLFVCHHCDTRSCVNPDHMFLGTNRDNMDDMVRKGRSIGKNQGAGHGLTKFTDDSIRELRLLRSQGWTYDALAEYYEVGKSTVARIITGKVWSHVK